MALALRRLHHQLATVPAHTYAPPSTYAVALTARNRYGASTSARPGYLTVASLNRGPQPAACVPVPGLLKQRRKKYERVLKAMV